MQPRMLVTFDEELRPLPVSVRVGQVHGFGVCSQSESCTMMTSVCSHWSGVRLWDCSQLDRIIYNDDQCLFDLIRYTTLGLAQYQNHVQWWPVSVCIGQVYGFGIAHNRTESYTMMTSVCSLWSGTPFWGLLTIMYNDDRCLFALVRYTALGFAHNQAESCTMMTGVCSHWLGTALWVLLTVWQNHMQWCCLSPSPLTRPKQYDKASVTFCLTFCYLLLPSMTVTVCEVCVCVFILWVVRECRRCWCWSDVILQSVACL